MAPKKKPKTKIAALTRPMTNDDDDDFDCMETTLGGEAGRIEGDDDDDDDPADDGEQGEHSSSNEPRKGKGKGKKAKKEKKGPTNTNCFILSCPENRQGRGKYCTKDRRIIDNMFYQAANEDQGMVGKPAIEALTKVMGDPTRAEHWFKNFKWRTQMATMESILLLSGTNSAEDMTSQAFTHIERLPWIPQSKTFGTIKLRRTGTKIRILAKWKEHKDDRSIERTGAGSSLVLWIPQRQQQIQDKSKSIVQSLSEGSKKGKMLEGPRPAGGKNLDG